MGINHTRQIKGYASKLGFDACGFCKAEDVGQEKEYLQKWLDKGYNADMQYLANNFDKRCNPTLLFDGAKSIISLALKYYPQEKQIDDNPQFAYYADGKDYHDVMKHKMQLLLEFIQQVYPHVTGRVFCDTAPLLERYWAAKTGIGFVGKNTLLIIPGKGSYFFLGEIVLDIELEYDKPQKQLCGSCSRCLSACPTKALKKAFDLDSNKCISYQTIENKKDIDEAIIPNLSNCVYGCDICQQVCPWNRFASPHNTSEFDPAPSFLSLSATDIENMTNEEYQYLFKGSAVKRAKYSGLKRNINALKK